MLRTFYQSRWLYSSISICISTIHTQSTDSERVTIVVIIIVISTMEAKVKSEPNKHTGELRELLKDALDRGVPSAAKQLCVSILTMARTLQSSGLGVLPWMISTECKNLGCYLGTSRNAA